jgi:hypothetical protein
VSYVYYDEQALQTSQHSCSFRESGGASITTFTPAIQLFCPNDLCHGAGVRED